MIVNFSAKLMLSREAESWLIKNGNKLELDDGTMITVIRIESIDQSDMTAVIEASGYSKEVDRIKSNSKKVDRIKSNSVAEERRKNFIVIKTGSNIQEKTTNG